MTASPVPSRLQRLLDATLVRLLLAALATTLAGGLVQQAAADQLRGAGWLGVAHLCGAVAALLGYAAYVRAVERRPVSELALAPAARELAVGLAGGALLVGTVIGGLALLGVYRVDSVQFNAPALATGLSQMLFIAVMEEILMRGILMRLLERAWGSGAGLLLSSLVFGLGHLPTDAAGAMALLVAVVAGLFFGAAYLATRRLWLAIALHAGWNFTLGHVLALVVSGHERTPGLVDGHLAGSVWLTGGAYGLEASVLTLGVLLVGTALLLRKAHQRGQMRPRSSRAAAAALGVAAA